MSQHPEPGPRDDRDAAQDIARDLADMAGQLASLKGEANAWLSDPNYGALRLRLENALAAAEAAAVEARDGGCASTRNAEKSLGGFTSHPVRVVTPSDYRGGRVFGDFPNIL